MIDDEIREVAERIVNKLFEDVVEVVRCKDCKYWRNHGKEYPTYCVRPDLLDLYADDYGVEMTADDFCSRGEKR